MFSSWFGGAPGSRRGGTAMEGLLDDWIEVGPDGKDIGDNEAEERHHEG